MPPSQLDDHDLLIRLDAKLDALSAAFADIKTSLSGKAEGTHLTELKVRVDKLEGRTGNSEKKIAMIAGGLIVIDVVIGLVLRLLK